MYINHVKRKIQQKLVLCYSNYLAIGIAPNISDFIDIEML